MPKTKHCYRVSVYLGKETYEQIEAVAELLDLPVSSVTRAIAVTGLVIAKATEKGRRGA